MVKQAEALLEMATRSLDPNDKELVEAARELRDAAVEYDKIATRFETAGERIKTLLLDRMS